MIEVYFTQKNSNYNLSNKFDCYDKERNSLSTKSKLPAIYHPPCRTWGRLRGLSNNEPGEHLLAVWSILRIWRYGGVLEHPAGSKLWDLMKLPLPGSGYDKFGGFSISINQSWFGFKAEKNTWLYIKGCKINEIPSIELSFDAITHVVTTSKKGTGKKELSKGARSKTPVKLIKWLSEVIEVINAKNML